MAGRRKEVQQKDSQAGTSLVGDHGQVLRVLGWALTRIRNISLVASYYAPVSKGAEEWLCVEQSRELFSDIRGRGGASNACFHS